ncbi:hypothetical protein TR51_28930 [Kitasatospora griseola]|uniref:Uncharacterized protein n=1 Tax=Kitasatospora griseola TaxID=2064 RepID=A0A0D0PK41_KITGR|nr:hypothetical protein [Kitasatospora griseola]KIQ62914.1 hypothetical protein TR51_28930 [Kitasatospora griseola]
MTLILLAAACLLAVTLGYAGLCAASPFGDCRKCDGLGHLLTFDRHGKPKRGKTCRRCKGVGKRIRVGRHLFNIAHRTWHAGTN